jgi:putative NIF3 family GTP cyclohydrolase 1 type 2
MVVSSHFRFDETLTIGYNPHLAGRLGCPEETLYTLSGYKSDPSRRIGSLGALKQEETLETALDRIATEFELPVLEGTESTSSTIRALALMNAFDEAQVDQVATHFQQAIEMPVLPTQVLYITGQTREAGAGRAAALDMPVVFVGHREAEAWGIRRLAQLLQEAFPDVQVETSFEPEAEKVRQPKKTHEEVEI